MAGLTFIFASSTLLLFILWKIYKALQSPKIPAGLKPLPGPKGTCMNFSGHKTFHIQIHERLSVDL